MSSIDANAIAHRTDVPLIKQAPSLGRIVHYYTTAAGPFAAMIVGVGQGGACDLVAFFNANPPTAPVSEVPFSEEPKLGHWSWPPRV